MQNYKFDYVLFYRFMMSYAGCCVSEHQRSVSGVCSAFIQMSEKKQSAQSRRPALRWDPSPSDESMGFHTRLNLGGISLHGEKIKQNKVTCNHSPTNLVHISQLWFIHHNIWDTAIAQYMLGFPPVTTFGLHLLGRGSLRFGLLVQVVRVVLISQGPPEK